MGYEEEDFSGRCAAILTNGKRCPNAALPNSRYCGLPAHQALADQPTDEVGASEEAEAAEEPPPAEDALAGTAPEEDAVPGASSTDVADAASEPAADGAVPAEADGFGEGTSLAADAEDPGDPGDGVADSPANPDGASVTAEPEFGESDPEGELQAADSDPVEQRLEER